MNPRLKRIPSGTTTIEPSLASNIIEAAFRDLEQIVTPDDARKFSNTTLEDVRKAALSIEKQLEARQSLCSMRRLEPLFTSLKYYSKPLEILCNGTPYLPWVWAPIKLILQASDILSNLLDSSKFSHQHSC
jgi:hypothetical protein